MCPGARSSRLAAGRRRGAGRVHVAGAAAAGVGHGERSSEPTFEAHRLKRVVVASVHEDIVAHLRPSWLFPTAVATSCWQDDGKKPQNPQGTCATAAS